MITEKQRETLLAQREALVALLARIDAALAQPTIPTEKGTHA